MRWHVSPFCNSLYLFVIGLSAVLVEKHLRRFSLHILYFTMLVL